MVLYVGCALILCLVLALVGHAVFSPARPIRERRWLLLGGLVFPGTVLSLLLLYALAVGATLQNFSGGGALRFLLDCISGGARALASPAPVQRPVRIYINARQWWWEVRYLTGEGEVALANELYLPAGRAIDLVLEAEDVIHSFWVPSLAGKVDMIPGRINRLRLKADTPGVHRGQCAEYCGGQHALMALFVFVQPETEFERWLARQAMDASPPSSDFLALGQAAFMRGGCADCHTVRGTSAQGLHGPDLTHVGSRHSLAAGVLDNHVGTMAGWIASPQDLKPGSLMPDNRSFSGSELRAVSAWLGSLK